MRSLILLSFLIGGISLWAAEDDKSPDQTVDRAAASISNKQAATATPAASADTASHLTRNYPGGRDEEDLKVQETIVNPTVKIDRRAIESKVLKVNLKVDSDEPEATEQ